MVDYMLSPYIRKIFDPSVGNVLVYHSLFGNPRILNQEGWRFLELFQQPKNIEEIK